jgi:hypothetical protein
MKLVVEKNLFCISEIEFDIMQNIINALIHENNKNEARIEYLNQVKENYINQDVLQTEIEMTNNMLGYISDKHKEINDFLSNYKFNKIL